LLRKTIFIALHCTQCGIGDRKSVRPSFRRVNSDKTKEASAKILTPYIEETFI